MCFTNILGQGLECHFCTVVRKFFFCQYRIDIPQKMNANVQIDADSIHIGPTIACSNTQNVDTEIQIHCCKMSEKVKLKFYLIKTENVL